MEQLNPHLSKASLLFTVLNLFAVAFIGYKLLGVIGICISVLILLIAIWIIALIIKNKFREIIYAILLILNLLFILIIMLITQYHTNALQKYNDCRFIAEYNYKEKWDSQCNLEGKPDGCKTLNRGKSINDYIESEIAKCDMKYKN